MKIANEKSGFSLLEAIAAIFVITFGLLSVVTLVNQNYQVQYMNKNNLIASQLAQEGLELVRSRRDSNWLDSYDWKSGDALNANSNIVRDGSYTIETSGAIDDTVNSITDAGAQLYIDPTFKTYVYASGDKTVFSRIINVVDNGDYLTVSCLVQWKERGRTHDYKAETLLYNWR